MKIFVASLLLLLLIATCCCAKSRDRNNKPHRVVCYWGAWRFYRPGLGKFEIGHLNTSLCTHIIYASAKLESLSNHSIAIYDTNLDVGDTDPSTDMPWGHGMYRKFNALRNSNPNLTTLIGIGDWNEGSDKYSEMARTQTTRRTFINSVLRFLQEYGFDGLDLDWEYPAKAAAEAKQGENGENRTPGNSEDKQNFAALVRELHEAFAPHGYVLSAAVAGGKETIDGAYDVPSLSRYLDFISLMTYDYFGAWDPKTGHNAPLFPAPGSNQHEIEFSVSYTVDYYLALGADPKKLVLGIPFYGRSFTLQNAAQNGIGAPARGPGQKGPYSGIDGHLSYNEICTFVKSGEWKTKFDTDRQVPFAYRGDQWFGYESPKSVELKVQFLRKKGLSGAMIWMVNDDDFRGACGDKYSLLKTVNNALTRAETIETPKIPRSPSPSDNEIETESTCTSAGVFPECGDSNKFHVCIRMDGAELKHYTYECSNDEENCAQDLNKFTQILNDLALVTDETMPGKVEPLAKFDPTPIAPSVVSIAPRDVYKPPTTPSVVSIAPRDVYKPPTTPSVVSIAPRDVYKPPTTPSVVSIAPRDVYKPPTTPSVVSIAPRDVYKPPTTPSVVPESGKPKASGACRATGVFASPGMDAWCHSNCNHIPSRCPDYCENCKNP